MIKRLLEGIFKADLFTGKSLILMGARQTGKTTLLKQLFSSRNDVLWLNGDEVDTITLFENASSSRLKAIIGDKRILIVDEAQRIENVGLKLKLITDQIPEIQLVATGSSSFELANKINEPLTGRKWEYKLFPVSFFEMVNHHGLLEEKRLLKHRLVYGYYPEVLTSQGKERKVLREISDSYLYKDILKFEQIKKPDKLIKLLQALALQIGNEVLYNELGKVVGLNNETVEKYISLLEKVFIIFRLPSFSRNLRKELKLSRKVYFYDNGIRNALIANFSMPELRQDNGPLWENFVISERLKYLHYNEIWANCYFWRTSDQQEIDYIEDRDGKLFSFEFKWNPAKTPRVPLTFSKAYPGHEFQVITPENFEYFFGFSDAGE